MTARVARTSAAVVAALLAFVATPGELTSIKATTPAVGSPQAHQGVLGPPTSVSLRTAAISAAVSVRHRPKAHSFLTPSVHSASGAQLLPATPSVLLPTGGATRPRSPVTPSSGGGGGSSTSGPDVLTAFPAASLTSDVLKFGPDQSLQPPDTQVAAGPDDVVQAVNDTLHVWSKARAPIAAADLNVFFNVPIAYGFSDPRVLYDAAAGRWLLSGLAHDNSGNSIVYVAISQSSDPAALYSVYRVSVRTGVVQDQPRLGLDSDVVVLSWDDYSTDSLSFFGEETRVLQKSDMLVGNPVTTASFSPDKLRFGIVPVQSLAPTTTEYLAYNDSCGPNTTGSCNRGSSALGLVAIIGTPAAGNVMWKETTDPAIAATTIPPAADQPGAIASLQQDDDRFLTANSAGGVIFISGTDGCVPSGDTAMRPCSRLIEVAVGGTSAVTVDSVLAYVGGDLYYPAAVPDANGNVFIAATFSSASVYPEATGLLLPPGASSFSAVAFQLGAGTYTDTRWGDYSGAAVDPSNPTDVWVSAEYAPVSGTNWGTAIGELTVPGPPNYTLDGFGGVHPAGSAPPVATTGYWPGWDIARGIVTRPDHQSGYVLDGFGGIHPFGSAPPVSGSGYWPGWDIARGIALTPDGGGGWVLDGWGGVHQFGTAPAVNPTGYWTGWDIARGIAADATGRGGWVLDGWGGIHPFGSAPTLPSTGYWPGWDIARGIMVLPGKTGGYVLDGWGGLHQFGDAIAVSNGAYWPGWKIARGIVAWEASSSAQPGGWVVDGFGGVHAFGSAPAETAAGYWGGWDIVRGVG